ncbi:MAG: hypothetical protein QOH63_3018 [Acidobacteriota bacterium]|jgi:hypothetical protein|nr:hypothetical protein [Acidobacteriota bacterium]
MRNVRISFACFSLILSVAGFSTAQITADPHIFDKFVNVNCEDEMARLDNYAIQLQNTPSSQAYIIVYGGRVGRRGEARARASRIKSYLVENRGIDANHVTKIDGGYRESLTIELWIIPRDVGPPASTPTLRPRDIRFKRGKIKRWEYRQCGLGY